MTRTKQRNILNNLDLYIFIFFVIYFFLGVNIYKDFGISFDENINRTNGFVSLNYIINLFNLNIDLSPFYKNIPFLEDYVDREYGVLFDLPAAFLEVLMEIKNSKETYLLRHLMTFIIFYLSSLCFYFLCLNLFKEKFISAIGVIFLILSPRIFAESFYNSKDITFLSFFIFSIFFNIRFLNQNNSKNIFFAAFFSALMTDIRVIGIFLPFVTILFFFLNTGKKFNEKKFTSFFKYLIVYVFVLFIFWPFLWENGFSNLITAIREFKNYPWEGDILYFGEYINAKFVPWHYFFIWFFITTPLIYFIIIFCALFFVGKIFIINLVNIEKNSYKNLWNNQNEMNLIYFFSIFFIPLFFIIIFNSTLYSGWRQLYFLYPPLIILSLYFIEYLKNNFFNIFKLTIILIVIQMTFTSFFVIKNHPHQYVYFNYIANIFIKDKFAYDYWGVSNNHTIKHLLNKKNLNYPLKISTASFTDLNKTKLILDDYYKDKFIFIENNHEEADFIFSNHYYFKNPRYNQKRYKIPENFSSYYKLIIDKKIINELYINKLKYN